MKEHSSQKFWTPKTYNLLSKFYDSFSWVFSPIGEDAHRQVAEGLTTGTILDVGCGTGTLIAFAHRNGLRCFGIDTSEGMLSKASEKVPEATFINTSFYRLPFADETFDYVTETNALSGAEIDTKQALTEMLRVCKIGGMIRIADFAPAPHPTWKTQLIRLIGQLTGDTPIDYRSLFRDLGYESEVKILGGHDMYQLFSVKKET